MENIISNIIIWGIVPLLIGRLTYKANLRRKKVSEGESGKSYSIEGDRFVIEIGHGVKLILIIGAILYGNLYRSLGYICKS